MALTLQQLEAQLDALTSAITLGVTQTQIEGRVTQYRTLDDMYRARDTIEQQIALHYPDFQRPRAYPFIRSMVARTNKGVR